MALAILNVEAGEKGIFESESLKMKWLLSSQS
jgi:hypothetical protein